MDEAYASRLVSGRKNQMARIVSVTGEEKSVRTIDQGNGLRGVTRGCDHFYGSTAKVEAIAVVRVSCNRPRTRGVDVRVESVGQGAANLVRVISA